MPRLRILCCIALACVLASPGASAQDYPKRKSGLWEISVNTRAPNVPGAPSAASMKMCIDEKTDNAVQQQAQGMTKESCSRQDMKKSGNQIVVDSVCRFGDTTATTHSVFTGSFDSQYKVETRSTYDPPMMGTMKEGSAVIEARWVGPCSADMRPGDMILGNGMKINMNDTKGPPPPRK